MLDVHRLRLLRELSLRGTIAAVAQSTLAQQSWRAFNPDSRYELFTDASMDPWIRSTFASVPALVAAWDALPDVIFKTDLFRLLILFAEGGVYSDSDTICTRPIG